MLSVPGGQTTASGTRAFDSSGTSSENSNDESKEHVFHSFYESVIFKPRRVLAQDNTNHEFEVGDF